MPESLVPTSKSSNLSVRIAMAMGRVIFVGVDTSGSRVYELFPRWMDAIGADAWIEGIDLRLDAAVAEYRSLVEWVAADTDVLGAVVTSHKLRLFAACAALFAEVDDYARLTHEASCLHKTARGLAAAARDPLAVRAVLAELDPRPTEVLCLGAGGAATAIAVSLLSGGTVPRRAIFTDVRLERLQALRASLARFGPATTRTEFVLAHETEAALASLPPGALVVNATGLGKDAPGSPIAETTLFPIEGVVWELNYRGNRPFLTQALRQRRERRLRVHDGWLYFLHGWFQSLAPILGFPARHGLFERFHNASA